LLKILLNCIISVFNWFGFYNAIVFGINLLFAIYFDLQQPSDKFMEIMQNGFYSIKPLIYILLVFIYCFSV